MADIDECRISFGICTNGHCINTPGMFRCECDSGYIPVMMDQMCMGKYEFSINNFWMASILGKIQQTSFWNIFIFSQKIDFDISCKLTPKPTEW